jgi:hypothetical protein
MKTINTSSQRQPQAEAGRHENATKTQIQSRHFSDTAPIQKTKKSQTIKLFCGGVGTGACPER